jgi:charged multivesicular body protein 4
MCVCAHGGLTGAAATQALRRKKMAETELDKLAGTRLQLEMQVNTLESANLNAETMAAMKKGSEALKVIHKGMCVRRPARAAPR